MTDTEFNSYACLTLDLNMSVCWILAICDVFLFSIISRDVSCMLCEMCCIWVCMSVFQARCFGKAPAECSTSQHSLHSFQVHGTWLLYLFSSLFTSKVSSSGALVACCHVAWLCLCPWYTNFQVMFKTYCINLFLVLIYKDISYIFFSWNCHALYLFNLLTVSRTLYS